MSGATIFDVAKAAGVSPSTVSRALNNGAVSERTRERIGRLADQLGYRPASSSASRDAARRGVVGLLLTDIGNYYFTDALKGVFATAQSRGYRVEVVDVTLADDQDEAMRTLTDTTDGQLLFSPRIDDARIARWFSPRTAVLASRVFDGFPSVVMNDRDGIVQAVRHLASLGHRRIAFVGGSETSWSNEVRRDAFSDACADYGIESVLLGPFEPSYAGGAAAADALMLEDGVTGAVAFNDLVAGGLMGVLQGRGVAIPTQMSIVGIDDSVLSRVVRPQLTTVDIRQERMGSIAMQMLIDRLEADASGAAQDARDAPANPPAVVVPELLIARDSTGRAPRDPR
ncbi:transcriptional regulator, LacI family [Bifidobacterium sp. DSM 109958]|uniref:Transcriptional regulator, LacI family n=1 Tax=Bifidobacterium moraviense TaxID=2675323 RepID=A0A7Y0F320_9BIFI|nr:LacI family DNA-binding transcriptional regulator [Bifidobacterium sp. DSM 109958]NMN01125.1 transcriptional regulator, LacI family [Bifidobacterium sp. DSM 109958]